jgi:hypothetical protein
LRETGKFSLNLSVNAGGHEGKTLEQSLDKLIRAGFGSIPVQGQPPGNLGVFTGKLARRLAKMPQLCIV